MAETLGSYNDFIKEKGLQHSSDAILEYSLALQALRERLAQERGTDLEDLHSGPIVYYR